MSLQDLGNLGEFVGAVAVVVSLVYLAVQIRQNTQVVRANVELDNARLAAEFNSQVAGNPELVDLWRRSASGEPLDADEQIRWGFLMANLFYRLEGLYRQHRRGLLPAESWAAWDRLLVFVLANPITRSWWDSRNHPFSGAFVEHVESVKDSLTKAPTSGTS